MSIGTILQEARKKRNLSASQVAAGTRMKIQLVEGMESDDFTGMAAPIYAKGFIKLYAEYVGLDPAVLIREYVNVYISGGAPALETKVQPMPVEPEPAAKPEEPTTRPAEPTASPSPISEPASSIATEPSEPNLESSTPESVDFRLTPEPELEQEDLFSQHSTAVAEPTAEREPKVSNEDTTVPATSESKPSEDEFIDEIETIRAPLQRNTSSSSIKHLQRQISETFSAVLDKISVSSKESSNKIRSTVRSLQSSGSPVKIASIIAGCILVLVILISGISALFSSEESAPPPSEEQKALEIGIELPAPYYK